MTNPDNDTMLNPVMIPGLTESLRIRCVRTDYSHFAQPRCQISSCNSLIVFMSPRHPFAPKTYPAGLLVFRIKLKSRFSNRVPIEIPDVLSFISVHLHPALPYMAMCYTPGAQAEIHDEESEPPQLHLRIVNLESLVIEVIDVPEKTLLYIKR